MFPFGRKRTFDFVDSRASERPLWRKADIPEYPQDFHKIDQLGTSAFRPEADIELILVKRSANDPKRTLWVLIFRRNPCAYWRPLAAVPHPLAGCLTFESDQQVF